MAGGFSKKSIIQKTIQVGGSTLLSRILGVVREVLVVNYLGAGVISDAFFTAFKIPNSLRKIFAEGALSAAFIPTLVSVVHEHGKKEANRLMALGFLIFEGILIALCAWVMWEAPYVVQVIAPGFDADQVLVATPYLRILMPFIFFISSSALLAGALQSVGHFFVPAFSPVLLNIVFISTLLLCLTFSWPVEYLCIGILFGGLAQFLMHLCVYFKRGFGFDAFNRSTWQSFNRVLTKFLPCLISMSVMEISLFVDTSFASFLPPGSMTLLYYANRFMGIPLGVFGVALSTILLPHFSRISMYAPKRLGFYFLETTKLVFWVMVPVALGMSLFADKIFSTIFPRTKFTMLQVHEAQYILIAFLIGLVFYALNKILLNFYYSLHVTWIPTVISVIATLLNIGMNFVLMPLLDATGLALATSISALLQTVCFALFLYVWFDLKLYIFQLISFMVRYMVQIIPIFCVVYLIYYGMEQVFMRISPSLGYIMLETIVFWLWIGPVCFCAFAALYFTRKLFGIRLYFLEA